MELTATLIEVLALAGAVAAVSLVVVLVVALVASAVRVGVGGRPLVLPFSGADPRRDELTRLFAQTYAAMLGEWRGRVERAQGLAATPDADTGHRADPGPRPSGAEPMDRLLELHEGLADPDLGTISLGGVSFSPQQILAAAKRLPALVARCRVTGSVFDSGSGAHLIVRWEERSLRRRRRAVHTASVAVAGDDWVAAMREATFQITRSRMTASPVTGDAADNATREVFVDAATWSAARPFLCGYMDQLRYYRHGSPDDRDRAIAHYDEALANQPEYPRAAYNRAALLYAAFDEADNEAALAGFEAAARSDDPEVQALAWAGITMACGQAVTRFGRPLQEYLPRADLAATNALRIRPDLAESRFACGWLLQMKGRCDDAVAAYLRVAAPGTDGDGPSDAEDRRVRSYALNNAAWLLMRGHGDGSTEQAATLLTEAIDLYPNAIAWDNMAAVEIRRGDHDRAEACFARAVALNPRYAAAWHEYAVFTRDRAREATVRGADDEAIRLAGEARLRHEASLRTAGPATAARYRAEFAAPAPVPAAVGPGPAAAL